VRPCEALALIAVGTALTGCGGQGIVDPKGPVASAERLILINSTAIMLCVVLPVIVLTLFFAWRYRSSNTRAVYRPDWGYSGKIELVVWAVPAMVVMLLAGVGWVGSHQLDPARPLESPAPPVRIEGVALDWKWLFLYPDLHVGAVNEVVVPVGVPVEFTLTSATVMNAFFVPQLGSQIYTMPGMTSHLNLLAAEEGHYQGFSSHFSGNGFSDMRFVVHALPAAGFADWLAKTRASGESLDADGYAALADHAGSAPARTYGNVSVDLFAHIVRSSVGMPERSSVGSP
jgi:cytochrome o ubiquinol oxidase subunit 2